MGDKSLNGRYPTFMPYDGTASSMTTCVGKSLTLGMFNSTLGKDDLELIGIDSKTTSSISITCSNEQDVRIKILSTDGSVSNMAIDNVSKSHKLTTIINKLASITSLYDDVDKLLGGVSYTAGTYILSISLVTLKDGTILKLCGIIPRV